MAQEGKEDTKKQKEEGDVERVKAKYKFILALGLFILFGIILITSIFVLKDTESVVSVAGIFSAWMGAIITFYYMEHQSTERVREARESEKRIQNELEDAQNLLPQLQKKSDEATLEVERTLDELTQQLKLEREKRHRAESELEKFYAAQGSGGMVEQLDE
jgi:uncharacterized protein YlxW (UPF0749 family)